MIPAKNKIFPLTTNKPPPREGFKHVSEKSKFFGHVFIDKKAGAAPGVIKRQLAA
jgi:hypothetical protein